jgi:hypothetical protein
MKYKWRLTDASWSCDTYMDDFVPQPPNVVVGEGRNSARSSSICRRVAFGWQTASLTDSCPVVQVTANPSQSSEEHGSDTVFGA